MNGTDFRKDRNVKIEREDANDHPGREFAHAIQEKAGKTLSPTGFQYDGTLTVHIYSKTTKDLIGNRTDSTFISVIHGLKDVPEAMADAAIKTLTAEVMRGYGRKVPEWRKT